VLLDLGEKIAVFLLNQAKNAASTYSNGWAACKDIKTKIMLTLRVLAKL